MFSCFSSGEGGSRGGAEEVRGRKSGSCADASWDTGRPDQTETGKLEKGDTAREECSTRSATGSCGAENSKAAHL